MVQIQYELTLDELDHLYQHSFINNTVISIVETKKRAIPLQFIKSGKDEIAVYDREKGRIFFAAGASERFAKEVFAQMKSSESIKLVEGPRETLASLADVWAREIQMKLSHLRVLKINLLQNTEYGKLQKDAFEFVRGIHLLGSDSEALVRSFLTATLQRTPSEDEPREILASDSREFLGLKLNGRIVSILALTRHLRNYRCISYVTTKPELRGQGLSHSLFLELLRSCEGRYAGLFLQVDAENDPAIHLYSKLGFVEAGQIIRLAR